MVDAAGEWTLGAQGGYQAPGMDTTPDMSTAGWVKTNGNYGHGCGCMTVRTDKRTKRVTQIINATPIPLARYRADKKLPKP